MLQAPFIRNNSNSYYHHNSSSSNNTLHQNSRSNNRSKWNSGSNTNSNGRCKQQLIEWQQKQQLTNIDSVSHLAIPTSALFLWLACLLLPPLPPPPPPPPKPFSTSPSSFIISSAVAPPPPPPPSPSPPSPSSSRSSPSPLGENFRNINYCILTFPLHKLYIFSKKNPCPCRISSSFPCGPGTC